MSEIVLRDIDPVLADRIRRVADARRWTLPQTLLHLLEQGLFSCESEMSARFDDSDSTALRAAIAALEGVPNDPGFSLIGRVQKPVEEPAPLSPFDQDLLAFMGNQDR
jgi:hypothetical protein